EETGLVTAEQIETFIAEHSVLRGRINSPEFCRKHTLRPSDMPWFLIDAETGTPSVVYFFLEDIWREWPSLCPEDVPEEPCPATPPGSGAAIGTRSPRI